MMQKQKLIFTKEQLNELIANLGITKDLKVHTIIEICQDKHLALLEAIKLAEQET